jgi:SAM-dependent methyltransferase
VADPVDPVLSRLRDRLEVNPPYAGIVAEGYDAWLPVDDQLDDEPFYRRLVEQADGPVLELGCGTGRPLLRWVAAGLDVEGVEGSADMLAILRRHAAERGLSPTVHHGDIAPLDVEATYAAIVCPAGTFTLVDDADRAGAALASYHEHLHPGGTLAMTLYVPEDAFGEELGWRIRRTGTTGEGSTIVVHEAIRCDRPTQLQVVFNRIERYDPDGLLQETWLRRLQLRWWTRDQAEALYAGAGFERVRSHGTDAAWITVGRRST